MSHNSYVTKEVKEIEETPEESDKPGPRPSDFKDSKSLGLGIDWDENHQERFVKWVFDQKRTRQQEERKLQEQWGILNIERNNLEEQKRDLEAREVKLSEVKD